MIIKKVLFIIFHFIILKQGNHINGRSGVMAAYGPVEPLVWVRIPAVALYILKTQIFIMKDRVNIPFKSRWIGRMFLILSILTAILFVTVSYFVGQESHIGRTVVDATMIGVLAMVLIVTASFYNTKYKIKDDVLTAWSPFMFIKIKLKDIKSVEKVIFPFGFRVGASFYCGVYYVPNLGWVRVVVTNLRDAVLIKTRDGKKYIISPKNPQGFIKTLKK